MTITIAQTTTAVGPLVPASFLATGGTGPYSYSVLPGGAGGTINPSTGIYVAPATVKADAKLRTDTIRALDQTGADATTTIMVGTPLFLFCDILATELGLTRDRVYIFNQKVMQPTDQSLYIAVSVPRMKPFGSMSKPQDSGIGMDNIQSVNFVADVTLDLISRSTEALERQGDVVMALKSVYAQRQMNANSFAVSSLPDQFLDVSGIDGAAIPYHYRAMLRLQFAVNKFETIEFYDQFLAAMVTIDAYIPDVIDLIYGGDADSSVPNTIDAGSCDDGISDFIFGGGP